MKVSSSGQKILFFLCGCVINRWGCPRVLIPDNGKEFANKMVIDRLTEYGIVHSTIPPYHAQANPLERVNRNLRAMINSFLNGDHRDWDLHLVELGFALNTAVHSSLGVSPSFMNFGRNPTPSILLRTHLEKPQPILPPDLEKWKTRSRRLPALHDLVRRQLDKATATQAKYYNRKRREVYYQVGDFVRRRNHVLSSAEDHFAAKHAPKFIGPAEVIKVLSPVVYLVKDLNINRTTKVHVNDLKRFVPPRESAVAESDILNVSVQNEQPRREAAIPRAAGRQPLIRQQQSLRRPGEKAGQGSCAPDASVVFVSRRGRGFRPPNLAPPSPPRVREPSPPPAPQPPRQEPPPGYSQLACVTAPPLLPPARMQQIVVLPTHRAGSSRPGCWNCGCFDYSWVDCHQPRMRFCRMCGRHGCTIATCLSCCNEWRRSRLKSWRKRDYSWRS